MRRALAALLTVASIAGATLAGTGASAATACAGEASGGDWIVYGHDDRNTRHQAQPMTLGPGAIASLAATHVFSSAAAGGSGPFNSTPIVEDGCLYIGNQTGWVFALNADTLDVVWKSQINEGSTGLGGTIVGSLVLDRGEVLVLVNKKSGPYVQALDASTGTPTWRTTVDGLPGAFTNSSAAVYDDMLFVGISGDETRPTARGGYALVELRPEGRGAILAHGYTIDDASYDAGYAGGSVWTTPAFTEGFAYVGGGNPASKTVEHPHTNALLKIDVRRDGPTFGKIVDAYKGNVDQYYPGLDRQPACTLLGNDPRQLILGAWSVACLQLDLDFGASPSVFTDARGRALVGDLQKSGVYHAVYADTMELAWTSVVGAPCAACNASSAAVDDTTVYAAGSPAGQVVALSKDSGAYRWVSPIVDGVHFESVSVANGVVYTVDNKGFLNMFDAATGMPLSYRPMQADTRGNTAAIGSSGVAIARDAVFAAAGGYVVRYR